MGVEKFIEKAKEFLGLDKIGKEGKKKDIKGLLSKLRDKKKDIKKELKENPIKKRKRELEEEYEIIILQIKKGEKLLSKIQSK